MTEWQGKRLETLLKECCAGQILKTIWVAHAEVGFENVSGREMAIVLKRILAETQSIASEGKLA